MSPENTTYERIIAMWDIQDSLLQSYRTIFITSQSIFFSVAVFFTAGSQPLLALLPMAIGWYLLKLWRNVCRRRAYGVSFFQWQLLRFENGQPIEPNMFEAYKQWQGLGTKKQDARLRDDNLGKTLLEGPIRSGLDRILPKVFVFAWVIVLLIIAFAVYNMFRTCNVV